MLETVYVDDGFEILVTESRLDRFFSLKRSPSVKKDSFNNVFRKFDGFGVLFELKWCLKLI